MPLRLEEASVEELTKLEYEERWSKTPISNPESLFHIERREMKHETNET